MPPREVTPRSTAAFGESQPLMSSSSSSEVQEENGILQGRQEEESAWNHDGISSAGDQRQGQEEESVVVRSRTFWEAVQERRYQSDQEIARDAEALSRRKNNKYAAITFGQLLALIIASSNAASYVLENSYGFLAPNFLLFLMYTLLSFHLFFRSTDYSYTTNNTHHQPPSSSSSPSPGDNNTTTTTMYRVPIIGLRLKIPWYLYFLLSLTDVGAGIIMLIALQYTSLTSVTLLTSLTVPSTMICSKILLNKSFHKHHVLGACLCLIGGCLTIWSDLGNHDDNENNNIAFPGNTTANITTDSYSDTTSTTTVQNDGGTLQINWGDLLAVTAALLYGWGDAVSEYACKHIDRMELLGMLGLFGMVLTGIQFPFQEREVLSTLFFSDDDTNKLAVCLLIAIYVIFVLLYYVTEAAFLVNSDATLLNLSLQTQNLWAILFSVFANQAVPPVLFYLALALVIIGVFVYELGGPSADPVLQLVAASESETETGDLSSLQTQDTISRGAIGSGDTHHQERRRPGRNVQYDSLQQIEIT